MTTEQLGPSIAVDGAAVRYHRLYTAHLGVVGLAREMGISRDYIHKIESGKRPTVSPEMFGRLKAALGVDTHALLAPQNQLTAVG